MATLADMELFKSKLQTSDLTWVVSGKPVVALFSKGESAQHIGQPSVHNEESDVLLLWVGLEEKTHKLLVTLTLRLKMGADRRTRKNAQRKGRLMFLVIPTESLALGCADFAYRTLSKNDFLWTLLDMPSDTESEKCRLMDISFDIGAAKSYVIMNADPYKGPLQKQPMSLLRKFKTLSEVSRFHLFANHDEITQSSVKHIQAMLDGLDSMITPVVNLKGFYPGRRKAGINLWTNQGWYRDEEEEVGEIDPIFLQHHAQEASNPSGQNRPSFPPPPSSHSPPPAYAPQFLPSLPPTVVPFSGASVRRDVACVSRVHASISESNIPPCDKPACPDISPSLVPQYERIFSSKTPSPPPPSEPSLSSNYSADLLSNLAESKPPSLSDYETVAPPDPALRLDKFAYTNMHTSVYGDQSNHPPTVESIASRAASGTHHETVPASLAVTCHAHARNDGTVSSALVPDTPTRKRLSPFTDGDSAKRFTGSSASPSQQISDLLPNHLDDVYYQGMLCSLYNAGVPISPTVVDELSDQGMLLPPIPLNISPDPAATPLELIPPPGSMEKPEDLSHFAQDVCMAQWLIQAWDLCPSAHYTFIAELLRLGVAASDKDAEAFHICRVACTVALLGHCTQDELRKVSVPGTVQRHTATPAADRITDRVALDALPALISWLYILDPGAKMNFLPDLLRLSVLEQKLLHSSLNDEGEQNDLSIRYIRQKADIVSNACIRFCKEVSKYDERDITSKMLQEKERRGI